MMFHNPMFTTHLEYEERKKFKEYLNINLTVFIMISDQLYKQNLNSWKIFTWLYNSSVTASTTSVKVAEIVRFLTA